MWTAVMKKDFYKMQYWLLSVLQTNVTDEFHEQTVISLYSILYYIYTQTPPWETTDLFYDPFINHFYFRARAVIFIVYFKENLQRMWMLALF